MDNSVMVVRPIKHLPTAVTKGLVFSIKRNIAARADGKSKEFTVKEQALYGGNHKRRTKRNRSGRCKQKIIGSQIKTHAEFLKSNNRGGRLPSGKAAKVSGAELAKFRSGLITELAGIAETENGKR